MQFKVKKNTQLKRLVEAYCAQKNWDREELVFLFEGRRLCDGLTLGRLEMEDDDVIDVFTTFGGPRPNCYMENHVVSSIPAPNAIVPVNTQISLSHSTQASTQVEVIPDRFPKSHSKCL